MSVWYRKALIAINSLKHSGYYICQLLEHLNTLRFVHSECLCVQSVNRWMYFMTDHMFMQMIYHKIHPSISSTASTLFDPTSDLVRQYDFPVLLRCRKTSDMVFVAFLRPLSEPVWRFSSCSTDFSKQIVQVVLFLYLHDFLFYNCRIITSNPPTSLPPKTYKSWGVCGWQKNWIGKV
jgi:hypothetical protein